MADPRTTAPLKMPEAPAPVPRHLTPQYGAEQAAEIFRQTQESLRKPSPASPLVTLPTPDNGVGRDAPKPDAPAQYARTPKGGNR